MQNTTLCYIRQNGSYLMLHRVKKKNDANHDKWIGVGGKFLENESPDECLLREVLEETGLTLTEYRCRGVVTFVSDEAPGELMYLFTADAFCGALHTCSEGDLQWVPQEQLRSLPLWEGDHLFLELLAADAPFFLLKLCYRGDRLASAVLNGRRIR